MNSSDDIAEFAAEEYHRRLAGLRALMRARDLDAVLLTTESNHRYFTGHVTHRWTHKYTGIFALLPVEGDAVLIVTPMEASMCAEDSWIETIRTFPPSHTLQGIDAITQAVRELGLAQGHIGTELGGMDWMRIPYQDFCQLQSNFPESTSSTPRL